MFERRKQILVQHLLPVGTIEALDVGILIRLARLDVLDGHTVILGPTGPDRLCATYNRQGSLLYRCYAASILVAAGLASKGCPEGRDIPIGETAWGSSYRTDRSGTQRFYPGFSVLQLINCDEPARVLDPGALRQETKYKSGFFIFMHDNNPLGTLFLNSVRRYQHRVAIRSGNKVVTYGKLNEMVANFALHLASYNVQRGSLIGLNLKTDSVQASVAIMAITFLGARWIEFQPTLRKEKAFQLHYVLHGNPKHPDDNRFIRVTEEWYERPAQYRGKSDINFPGYQSADDPWFIAVSSGTTGSSKFMPISGRMFHQRILRLTEYPDNPMPFVTFDFFRRASNLAALHFLHAISTGATYVFRSSYKNLIAQDAKLIVGSPAHLAKFLKNVPEPEAPLLNEVRVVGGALTPDLLARLLKYFKVARASYGSTEAGPTTTRLITEYTDDRTVGQCYPDVNCEIVDENSLTLPTGTEGIVRIRTTSQIECYLGNAEATREALRDGWFYPGDKGYLSADGNLYIVGRIKDQLNVAGIKLNAGSIDEAIQRSEWVVDGMCFVETDAMGQESLSALVVGGSNADMKTIAKSIAMIIYAEENERSKIPTKLYRVAEIPRNANGKVMRHKALEVVSKLEARDKKKAI